MTMRLHLKLWNFIHYLRTSALELMLSISLIWWTWVIWFPSYHRFGTFAAMEKFSGVAVETNKAGAAMFWIVLGLLSSLVTLYGLVRKNFPARKTGILMESAFWASIWSAMLDYRGETGTKGMAVILWFTCLLAFVILGIEQRSEADNEQP